MYTTNYYKSWMKKRKQATVFYIDQDTRANNINVFILY